MSAAKHTPGKWAQGVTLMTAQTRRWTPEQVAANNLIERRKVFASFSSLDDGRARRLVATCEREEDASLIAAAPELLKALDEALKWADSDCPSACMNAVQKARAAIAKATGSAS